MALDRWPRALDGPGGVRGGILGLVAVLVAILGILVTSAVATSHWYVTEQGRIEPQTDSIFHLKRPYDLVAFMQQEERVDYMNQLRSDISTNDNFADMMVDLDDNTFQSELFNGNRHCLHSGIPLAEFDLYVTTLRMPKTDIFRLLDKFEVHELDLGYTSGNPVILVSNGQRPLCEMIQAKTELSKFLNNLTIPSSSDLEYAPEEALGRYMSVDATATLYLYEKAVTRCLQIKKSNWLATFYASIYWRVVGNAHEAIKCLKSSILKAPKNSKHIPLISLANVYHKARHSEKAVEVLLRADEYKRDDPTILYTLGNVYAILLKFENAAQSFKRSAQLSKTHPDAIDRFHAVKCHEDMEKLLERQHITLQETLEQLRKYKAQHDKWANIVGKMISEQASIEAKVDSQLAFERFSAMLKGPTTRSNQLDSMLSNINLEDNAQLQLVIQKLMLKLNKNIENRTQSDLTITIDKKENAQLNFHIREPLTPVFPPLFQKWILDHKDLPVLDESLLSTNECGKVLSDSPKSTNFRTVFLSPANRGFDIATIFSDHLNISRDMPANLPWYAPLCPKFFHPLPKYDRLKSFAKIRRLEIEVRQTAEPDINEEYSKYSPRKSFQEWGARINHALKNSTRIPDWITYVYAGSYWRLWGHPQNGLDCFKHALSVVPSEYLDIVLVNLSGLLYKVGSIDDAIALLKEAYKLNDKEPMTNYALGSMYLAKGNFSGSIFHMQQTLRMIPNESHASKLLQIAHCHLKQNKVEQSPSLTDYFTTDQQTNCASRADLESTPGLDYNEERVVICRDGLCHLVNTDDFIQVDQNQESRLRAFTVSAAGGVQSKGKVINMNSFQPSFHQSENGHLTEQEVTTVLVARDEVGTILPGGAIELGSVEIGTIAETEHEEDEVDDETKTGIRAVSHGPVLLVDDPLPDILIDVNSPISLSSFVDDLDDCSRAKPLHGQPFVSTWLSVSVKGIDIREYLGDYMEDLPKNQREKPVCPDVPNSMFTFDHLVGMRMKDRLHLVKDFDFSQMASEAGLKEAFTSILGTNSDKTDMEEIATRLSLSLATNQTSWVLSVTSALYWRVKGNTEQAIKCLKHALFYAPWSMRDVPLVSLANVFHRAGLYHDAIIVNNAAIELSPSFVVIHFTSGNIYDSMKNYHKAASFYLSTLGLQKSFKPAEERLRSLYCEGKIDIMTQP